MADEGAGERVGVAITVAATFTKINYSTSALTSVEVIDKINECVSHNQQIELELFFTDRFDATVPMQNTIVENSRHIKYITFVNYCREKEEHDRCFNFCTQIVLGLIGNGMHLEYCSFYFGVELEQANQLAEALLRLNNNNNDAIENFHFYSSKLNPVTYQTLWDALLDSGVPEIRFGNNDTADPPINYNNTSINFTRMEANESLKELKLAGYNMRKEEYQNLFHSIKKNKGLEILALNYDTYKELPEGMKRLFEEMMCENITLQDCSFFYGDDVQDGIFELIQFHMTVNRMWKRYLMQREREKKSRTVITRIEEGDNNNNNNNNEEEERKKRSKMRLLLHLFMNKPVMRDTVIFHLLREYPDDLIDTDHFRNKY